jgi:hypothetical protein
MLNKLSSVGILATFFVFLGAACSAQSSRLPNSSQENSLRKFLQDYVGNSDEGRTTRYSSAFVDLKDDGTNEVTVYLSGHFWCGAGGCTTLVLAPQGSSYGVVTKITVTRPPIRMLNTKSHGWHDISVVARFNAVEPMYEAALAFDGKSYPSNPSIPPSQKKADATGGKIVVPYPGEGTPLFQ